MRAMLLSMILVATVLAGCASNEPVVELEEVLVFSPGPDSHPAYGFATADSLPLAGHALQGLPADWYAPAELALPDTITSIVHEGQMSDAPSGAGIAIFGHYAYVGSYNEANFAIIDISDPTQPFVAGTVDAVAGDTDIIAFPPTEARPDGMLVAVTSTRGAQMLVIDVTDPAKAEIISTIETPRGNHNHQTVPGTPIVYNAPSDGAAHGSVDPLGIIPDPTNPQGSNDIWDLSDPYNPVHVKDFQNGYGCHAISFYVNATEGKYRGYCAGIEMTQIWDITDPLDPSVISTFPFPIGGVEAGQGAAPASFSHLAMVNHDASVLIVGDETGGGAGPGCDVHTEAAGQSISGPLGNLWFYDISGENELDPVLHGSYSPGAERQRGGCTAHFGDIVGDRPLIMMAFYTVGVALVDFSDLDNPREVDIWQPGETTDACVLCGTWDVQFYRGRAYTGDITRGMDFLSFA